jgi:hypothetical protein
VEPVHRAVAYGEEGDEPLRAHRQVDAPALAAQLERAQEG